MNTFRIALLAIALSALSIVGPFAPLAAAAPADTGIVLLHGKWGMPAGMQMLSRDLQAAGYKTRVPEMTWSGRRLYDKDYPAALKEVQAEVQALRGEGVKQVLIAGQSLGANAAVAYALSQGDIDGIALLAPGHFPERGLGGRAGAAAFQEARAMVTAGRGAESASFPDFNQGKNRNLNMPAATYVSFFDPNGLPAQTLNVRKLPRALPIMLAIGTEDPFYKDSRAMFDSAPAHPLSRYVVIESDHFDMPKRVSGELLKWLQQVAP